MEGMWTLILFTLLSQIAVGMVVLQALFGKEKAVENPCWAFVSLVIFALSGIASIFHLSSIGASFYTITNLGSSWLSREIVSVGAFGILLLLFCLKKQLIFLQLAGLAGIVLLVTTSYVYNVPTIPFWGISKTLPLFAFAGLLVGAVILYALDVLCIKEDDLDLSKKISALATDWKPVAIAITFACLMVCTHVHLLSAGDSMSVAMLDTYSLLTSLGVVGGLVFIYRSIFAHINKTCDKPVKCLHTTAIVMIVCVFIGALCNRILFFCEYLWFGM